MSAQTEWVIWFASLGTVSAVVLVALFTKSGLFGLSVEDIFYVIIAIVAVATFYRSFSDAVFLSRETKLASSQVRDLVELDDIAEFLKRSKKSIFRSHIESLFVIFKEDVEISQDSLIELLHDRLLARNRIAELFASILITLGLIGTIVGLIIMMERLRVSVAGFDPQGEGSLISTLMQPGGALSGLDTAFYTTLLGAIFGGVMLRVLTNVVEANITKYAAHIAELTEVNVLPSMRSMARDLEKSGYYSRKA